jgi:fructokinase
VHLWEGCIETFLSGSGLSRDHAEATGEVLAAELIAKQATKGDSRCAATIDRYSGRLVRALASVINLLDPQVIVLGGGVSQIPEIYPLVRSKWDRFVFSETTATQLLPNRFGASSGVRGAA